MHFRKALMAQYIQDQKEVFDEYHHRCYYEDLNCLIKKYYRLEAGFRVIGIRAITRHVLLVLITMHVVARIMLQRSVAGNILSIIHILWIRGIRMYLVSKYEFLIVSEARKKNLGVI